MKHLAVSFAPVDALNPACGYQIRIEDGVTGKTLLFTSVNPTTNRPLESPADCLTVASDFLNR